MTVTVTTGEDGRHHSAVPFQGSFLPCCETGHPDAEEAAGHAWKLARALARHSSREE